MRKAIFLITVLILSVFLIGCSTEKAGQAIATANEFENLDSTLSTTSNKATDHAILATQVDSLRVKTEKSKTEYDGDIDAFKKNFEATGLDIEKVHDLIEKSHDEVLIEAFKKFESDFQASHDSWSKFGKARSDFNSNFVTFLAKTHDLTADAITLEGDISFATAKADTVKVTALRPR